MLVQRNGVWYLSLRVNGRKVRKSLETADKAVALARAAEKLAALQRHGLQPSVSSGGPTLRESFNRTMRTRAEWRDAKDQTGLAGTYRSLETWFGADRALGSITEDNVLDWLDSMAGQAPTTINRKLSMLAVLCKEAGLVPPKMPRMTVRKGRMRTVTDHEVLAMLAALPPAMEPLVVVLLHTAARLSEALRLRWRDVDLDGRTVAIWENKASEPRIVPLSNAAHHQLSKLRGNGLDGPFADLTVDYCDHQWAKARKAIDLADDRQFVIHALRHTSLTRLAAAGVDAARIQKFAGHKQISTTMRYVHLNPAALRDLACVQDEAFGAVRSGPTRVPRFVEPPRARTHNPSVPGSTPGGPTNNQAPTDESAHSPPGPIEAAVGPPVGLNPCLRPTPGDALIVVP